MGYNNKEQKRAYQREWLAKRRKSWFEDNGPCRQCGSWENLELDHINPEDKIDHKVWSWSKHRMQEELSKCQVLCVECHENKSTINKDRPSGERHGNAKLTLSQVEEIRNSKTKAKDLAKAYNVHKTTIYYIRANKYWL